MSKILKNILLVILPIFFLVNTANAALVSCGGKGQPACTVSGLFNLGASGGSPFWINLIQTALGISGIIILCIFVYAGFRLMISGGDSNKISIAKKMMLGSFGGIILVFFSFMIVKGGLMILVGEKWSIYFGNSEISTVNTGAAVTVTPTANSCSNDSACLTSEYCCYNGKYNASNVKCTSATSGTCITKKASGTGVACIDNSECKTGECVTAMAGAKVCGCNIDTDCKVTTVSDYCCNSSLTAAGFSCSIPNACNTIHFAFEPPTANKLKTASGTVIENGRVCGTANDGSCIYVKKTIIDSSYYLSTWNIDSDNCDGRDTGDVVTGTQPRCFELGGVKYCLRCMKTSIYNVKK